MSTYWTYVGTWNVPRDTHAIHHDIRQKLQVQNVDTLPGNGTYLSFFTQYQSSVPTGTFNVNFHDDVFHNPKPLLLQFDSIRLNSTQSLFIYIDLYRPHTPSSSHLKKQLHERTSRSPTKSAND